MTPESPCSDAAERVQKLLERAGICSRRGAAEVLSAGRVRVNGIIVREPGFKVAPSDKVLVDGAPISKYAAVNRTRTVMLNKPAGLICSVNGAQGATVYECLKGISERIVPAGRLDRDSEGLLILSNDGDLINRITHPSFGHIKEYEVKVCGNLSQKTLEKLNSRQKIDGYMVRPANVCVLKELEPCARGMRSILRVVLSEGRNRQIRKLCSAAGLYVETLRRVAINSLRLPDGLRPGMWKDLSESESILLETPPNGKCVCAQRG